VDVPLHRFDLQDLRTGFPNNHAAVREELIKWIADEGLGGDMKAATWLLLLSIGKVSVTAHDPRDLTDFIQAIEISTHLSTDFDLILVSRCTPRCPSNACYRARLEDGITRSCNRAVDFR
jgi:hypothetical protein